jgi:hypothetical protein
VGGSSLNSRVTFVGYGFIVSKSELISVVICKIFPFSAKWNSHCLKIMDRLAAILENVTEGWGSY